MTVADMLLSSADEEVSLIEKAHVVELVIDVVKLNGCLSDKWREKLEDNHSTNSFFNITFSFAFATA